MIEAKCIEKHKDKHGKIIGYTLQDKQGQTVNIYSDALKEHIRTGKINVINLTLTSDNRLVTKETPKKPEQPKQIKQIKQDNSINSIISKAIVLGFRVDEVPSADNKTCYFLYRNSEDVNIYIPDTVKILTSSYSDKFVKALSTITGQVKFIGGENVTKLDYMFSNSDIKNIDFSEFKAKNITSVSYMFYNSYIEKIDISKLNINITNEADESMFLNCRTEKIIMTNMDLSLGNLIYILEELIDDEITIVLRQQSQDRLLANIAKKLDDITKGRINIKFKRVNNDTIAIAILSEKQETSEPIVLTKAILKNEVAFKQILRIYNTICNYDTNCEILDVTYYCNGISKKKFNKYKEIYGKKILDFLPATQLIQSERPDKACKNNTGVTISKLTDNEIKFGTYKLNTNEWIETNIDITDLKETLKNTIECLDDIDRDIEREIDKYYDWVEEAIEYHKCAVNMAREMRESLLYEYNIYLYLCVDAWSLGVVDELQEVGYIDPDKNNGIGNENTVLTRIKIDADSYITYGQNQDFLNLNDKDELGARHLLNTLAKFFEEFIDYPCNEDISEYEDIYEDICKDISEYKGLGEYEESYKNNIYTCIDIIGYEAAKNNKVTVIDIIGYEGGTERQAQDIYSMSKYIDDPSAIILRIKEPDKEPYQKKLEIDKNIDYSLKDESYYTCFD